jgi:hypothetical protein
MRRRSWHQRTTHSRFIATVSASRIPLCNLRYGKPGVDTLGFLVAAGVPDRPWAAAMFYLLRPGGPWAALTATELSAQSTAQDRLQEWGAADVFLARWHAGVAHFDEVRGLEWRWLRMDGVRTRAPGGWGSHGPTPTDRGKSGVTRSLVTKGPGGPIGGAVIVYSTLCLGSMLTPRGAHAGPVRLTLPMESGSPSLHI